MPGVDRTRADDDPELAAAVAVEEAELGETGRMLLRPSGTEPLVRVMVEAATADQADAVAAAPRRRRTPAPRALIPPTRAAGAVSLPPFCALNRWISHR